MATGVSEGPNWVKTQLGTPIPQLPGVRLPRDGLSAWPLHVVLVVKMWGPILPAWRSPNQMGGSGWININHTLVYPHLPICQLFTEVWYMHERQNQEGLVPKGSKPCDGPMWRGWNSEANTSRGSSSMPLLAGASWGFWTDVEDFFSERIVVFFPWSMDRCSDALQIYARYIKILGIIFMFRLQYIN